MGKKCQCCGYATCYQALELHHIDPNEKEFSFGSVMSNPKKWTKIVEELRKCILVCSNCHREIHACIRQLPSIYAIFDESFVDYKPETEMLSPCLICGKEKPKQQKTCSYQCAIKLRGTFDWSKINLEHEMKTKSMLKISQEIGMSYTAIRKRAAKLGLLSSKV